MAKVDQYELDCIVALIRARKQNTRGHLRQGVDMATGCVLQPSALTRLTKRCAEELGMEPESID